MSSLEWTCECGLAQRGEGRVELLHCGVIRRVRARFLIELQLSHVALELVGVDEQLRLARLHESGAVVLQHRQLRRLRRSLLQLAFTHLQASQAKAQQVSATAVGERGNIDIARPCVRAMNLTSSCT